MVKTLTRRLIIFCHLVRNMKIKGSIKEFLLTIPFAALMFVICVVVPIVAVDSESIQQEDASTQVVCCNCHATANNVDNYVQNVNNFVEEPVTIQFTEPAEPEYTDEEIEILALIVYQEAGGDACSDDTRRKVGSVFLNRVNSPLFPNTFKEVATQELQYGTLYLTGIQWPDRASTIQEVHAVKRAYAIAEELLINGSVLPENVVWQSNFKQGDGVYAYQDYIYFCYTER